jgi:hypothetical protein
MDHCPFDPILGLRKADCCTVRCQEGGKGGSVGKEFVLVPQSNVTLSKGCRALLLLALMRWCCILSYS